MPAATTAPSATIDAPLLYDLLVADIARQRNQPQAVVAALVRAADHTTDVRLLRVALAQARASGAYAAAKTLATRLRVLVPADHGPTVILAEANYWLGARAVAMQQLVQLASMQAVGTDDNFDAYFDVHLPILQTIAATLAHLTEPRVTALDTHPTPPTAAAVLTSFEQAVAAHAPENVAVAMTAALVAANLGADEHELRLLTRVLMLRPQLEFPAVMKLAILIEQRSSATVTAFATQHLEQFPTQTRLRLHYARYLLAQTETAAALVQLQRLTSRSPAAAIAWPLIGMVYWQQEDRARAQHAFRRALAADATNDAVRLYLAELTQQQSPDTAIRYLQAVTTAPHYVTAQIHLAQLTAAQENLAAGLVYLQRFEQQFVGDNIADSVRVLLAQAELLSQHQQYVRAQRVLTEGLRQFPDNFALLYRRGLLTARLEWLELHEQDMRKLITLQPENGHAYNALGYTLADKTARLDEALGLITHALQLRPDDPFVLDSMGWVHFRLGDHQQALHYLNRALTQQADAEIAAHLGEVLWQSGQWLRAREVWRQGQQLDAANSVLRETIDRFLNRHDSLHTRPARDA